MHSRTSRVFILVPALLVALPVVASASTSRLQGMALQGDYVKDYTNIYSYTSQVSSVGNLIYGELGMDGPEDRSVGAVMGDWWEGRYGTVAIHLREWTPQLGQGDTGAQPNPGDWGHDPNSNSSEQFDIMWGKKFGTTSFGARLHRSYGKRELVGEDLVYDIFSGEDANLSRNVIGLGAGLGFEMNPETSVEINAIWQSRTYKISDVGPPPTTEEEDGPTTYQLTARAFWQWMQNVMVVPVFKLYSYDLSTAVGTTRADNSQKGWQLWAVGANDLIVLGAAFVQNKVETEDNIFGVLIDGVGVDKGEFTETFSPMVFAALEAHVNSWLTLRFGASKGAWYTLKAENQDVTPVAKFTDRFSTFQMALGAGVKVGSVQLDGVLSNEFPHNGIYFVNGSDTDPLFTKVTATYPW